MGSRWRHILNWDKTIRTIRGDGKLEEEDKAVLRMIMQVALRFELEKRATAGQIVVMFSASWESVGM